MATRTWAGSVRGFFAVVAVIGWMGLAAQRAEATTIYVDGTAGDDGWSGLCATWDGDTCGPMATIQAGIGAATVSDAVVIADGTYTGVGNRDIGFEGKAITVRSASEAANCIIDCQSTGSEFHRGFYSRKGETDLPPVYVPVVMRVGP